MRDANPKPDPKHEIRSTKSETNSNFENENSKQRMPAPNSSGKPHFKKYDLEQRTFEFARRVRAFVKKLPRTIANIEDVRQLVKASGSVGSNYIEANNALSKRDFVMRIKICRKEAKESNFFLRLLDTGPAKDVIEERDWLVNESEELVKIFGSILQNSL